MKQIINISLGASRDDYELKTKFLGKPFHVQRFGTDGHLEKAADLLLRWNKKADAIGLGSIKFPYTIGSQERMERETGELRKLASQMHTPVTSGDAMRIVVHEWSIRHLQFKFGNNYFNNARVLFFSGMVNSTLAEVLSEYTENLFFADPILENGIPRLLHSIKDLELYANKMHGVLQWVPSKQLSKNTETLRIWNQQVLHKAIQNASMIVVPYHGFYKYVDTCTRKELEGKTVITSTAYDDRIDFLRKRGVDVIIDTTPKNLKRVVGMSVLEAMAIVALETTKYEITNDDLLEIIGDLRMEPRVIYPSGTPRRVNRFAFVVLPFSEEYLTRSRPMEVLSEVAPPLVKDTMERFISGSRASIHSRITGIRSPSGTEAEGWLISLGMSPEEMQKRSSEFITQQLLEAAKLAKRLGAQVVGISPLTKDLGNMAVQVAKRADIPITTGNSYIASSALWAAAEAMRRMGLIKLERGKILKGKTMVIGATGAVGSICCRLLAKAFEEVYMVSRNIAKLLALQESIQEESPWVRTHVSTRADKYISDMDGIVAASSGASRILDIMKVKPGCVITDITRPMILSPEEVAKRPDVLVIKSGEILLPGDNIIMTDLGLPTKAVPAGLAETALLALEGRFEVYTMGSDTEWEKVREIYRMGLEHGMQLAAISGVKNILSNEEIAGVGKRALEARKKKTSRPRSKKRAAQPRAQ